jgi:mRNA interferase MazF
MTGPAYLPRAGDLIWIDFDPTKGREQAGRRPALVVSPGSFSANTGLAIVCPITSPGSTVSDQRRVAGRPADRR